MIHFVFWMKFRVEIPPPPTAMLKADENFIDELTSMSSFSNQHCNGGGGGVLAVKGSSSHTGKASFKAKNICPSEFCPGLYILLYFLITIQTIQTLQGEGHKEQRTMSILWPLTL